MPPNATTAQNREQQNINVGFRILGRIDGTDLIG